MAIQIARHTTTLHRPTELAMAQEGCESSSKASAGSSGCSTPFRLNVHAREFVPVAPEAGRASPALPPKAKGQQVI